MNAELCIQLMDKLKYITTDLEDLMKNQYEIEKAMQGVEDMQQKLERYLVNLNNTKVLNRKRAKSKNKRLNRHEMLMRRDDEQ